MGYDYPECIGCYCLHGINEDSVKNYSICTECLSKNISLYGRARVHAEEEYSSKVYCECCKMERAGYNNMPFCDRHDDILKGVSKC